MENPNMLAKPQLHQQCYFMDTFYTFKQIPNVQSMSRASTWKV